jgi:RNA polymerase sigma-54 factor
MAIELRQQVKLTQQLVMTPQLQQAIKLLQLNRLELVTLVQQELTENPILEEVLTGEEPTPGEIADETPESGDAEPISQAEASEIAQPVSEPTAEAEAPSDVDKIADVDWEDYLDSHPQTGLEGRGGDDDERRSLDATLTKRQTLTEHLTWQLQLSDFDVEERAIAEWVIGNIDDDGYLQSTTEEMARRCAASEEAVEAVVLRVQTFDPTGVAARDLHECLMLQIRALEITDPLLIAIVDEHIDLLRKRDLRGLAKVLGVAIEEISVAMKCISRLEPWPGRAFGGEDPAYITPDIYLYKVGDDFHILLNEDGLPKLRISGMYRDVLARNNGVEKETKEYVHSKVRAAVWLIKSIHQRQRTIYKVVQSIVKYQREFFDQGVQFLKPLNLRDIADDIGMHESTVSRVTTNKYVHTPQGIFELKYFFNSGVGRFDGESVSSESVKQKIRIIISNEDPRRPLSDQRIAEMLRAAEIDIARRTVTKYREAMNVLSSTKRREIG